MNNLHIVTVATHSQYYFPYLVESCKRNGKELTVLGYGEKWKGFNWRFKLVLDYLNKLNGNDIVCFVDGYDVICTRNLNKLADEFLKLKNKHNCKIVVGEDKLIINNIYGYMCELTLKYYFGKCKNKSLNAGTYIGQVKDLINILEKIYNLFPIDSADDQILLTKYCKKNANDIYIDTENNLFLTLGSPYQEIDQYLNFKDNKAYYQNNAPFFIHGAGGTYLDNIIIKMNYPYQDKINIQIYNNFNKNMLFRIMNNNKAIVIITIIIITIIIIVVIIIYKKFIKNKIVNNKIVNNKIVNNKIVNNKINRIKK